MELQTVVKLERPAFQVDYTTPVMMLGSCFVENMGEKLKYCLQSFFCCRDYLFSFTQKTIQGR